MLYLAGLVALLGLSPWDMVMEILMVYFHRHPFRPKHNNAYLLLAGRNASGGCTTPDELVQGVLRY